MLNQQIHNYKVISLLGQGGMATVYLAHDSKFDTNVAIKLLNKEYTHNENIRKRFLAEAKSMFKMSHPNIIKVTDLIDEGETVAFVMEYVEGETLKEFIERKGRLLDDEIKAVFSQMLDSLGYVHEQNLVHRDIKPSNFMVTPSGVVKLMDFGIAKNMDTNSSEYTQTGTGVQMGTPMYMSPEQITETKSVTPQSDIYSLGVVLWQMVTGEKPYDMKTLSTFQLQMKIVQEELPMTNTNWDTIIEKAIQKNSEERFHSSNDFKNLINKLFSEHKEINENESKSTDHFFSNKEKPESDLEFTKVNENHLHENNQDTIIQSFHEKKHLGIDFVWVDGGNVNFNGDVIFIEGFYISKYPITQNQWISKMKNNPSFFYANGLECPVDSVSWYDCLKFIELINQESGLNFRMPTKFEWEFAANGGVSQHKNKFSGSDKIAWYSKNRIMRLEKDSFMGFSKKVEFAELGTHIVGKKQPNELGIYDMTGNIFEWCYNVDKHDYNNQTFNIEETVGPKILKGGSWSSDESLCLNNHEIVEDPFTKRKNIGFRIVLPK